MRKLIIATAILASAAGSIAPAAARGWGIDPNGATLVSCDSGTSDSNGCSATSSGGSWWDALLSLVG